jgi:hypothetical protein
MNRPKLWLPSLAVFVLSGCEPPPEQGAARFPSMDDCLEAIRLTTKLPLRVTTQTPEHVRGYLGDTQRKFSCAARDTLPGLHLYIGWYEP